METDEIRSIFQMFENALIRVPRFGNTTFAGAFWMMNTIHIGGVIVAAFTTVAWKNKKAAVLVLLISSLALFSQMDFYFSSLLLGAGIGLSYEEYGIERENITKYRYIVGLLSLVFAIFFGGGVSIGNNTKSRCLQQYSSDGEMVGKSFFVYHWIAAFLLILAIINLPFLKIILESKLVLLFGK